MKLPMRQKYVDEAVGIHIVFGTHADGTVDVHCEGGCSNRDVFAELPLDVAERVVLAQAEYRRQLYAILCGFPLERQLVVNPEGT